MAEDWEEEDEEDVDEDWWGPLKHFHSFGGIPNVYWLKSAMMAVKGRKNWKHFTKIQLIKRSTHINNWRWKKWQRERRKRDRK
jgi:hypothetical protein